MHCEIFYFLIIFPNMELFQPLEIVGRWAKQYTMPRSSRFQELRRHGFCFLLTGSFQDLPAQYVEAPLGSSYSLLVTQLFPLSISTLQGSRFASSPAPCPVSLLNPTLSPYSRGLEVRNYSVAVWIMLPLTWTSIYHSCHRHKHIST